MLKGNWLEIGGEMDPEKMEAFDSTTITLFNAVLKKRWMKAAGR